MREEFDEQRFKCFVGRDHSPFVANHTRLRGRRRRDRVIRFACDPICEVAHGPTAGDLKAHSRFWTIVRPRRKPGLEALRL